MHDSSIFRIGTPDQRSTYVHIVRRILFSFSSIFLGLQPSLRCFTGFRRFQSKENSKLGNGYERIVCVCRICPEVVYFVSFTHVVGVLFGRSAVQLLCRRHFHSFHFSFTRNTGDVTSRTHNMLYYKLLRDVVL